jgi:hypothetical protein
MSQRRRIAFILVGLAMMGGLLGACTPKPVPTQVSKISVERGTILVNEQMSLTVNASGDALQFKWTATKGSLSSTTAPSVVYTAPDSPGLVVVTVEVTGKGGAVVENVTLQVVAPTPTSTPTPTATWTPTPVTPTATPTRTSAPTNTPTPTSTPTPTTAACPPDPSKYGFEGEISWVAQTYQDSQACTAVGRSEKGTAKFGCYSLRCAVDLVGGDLHKSKGEAYVELQSSPPAGVTVPANLEGREITVWVYVPGSAVGDPSRPNGVQVFVKDQSFRNEYGTWLNLVGNTDKWIPVTFTPSRQLPPMGYMDSGFDPTNIIVLGVKIGAGGGSTATYKGPIWIDGVNW